MAQPTADATAYEQATEVLDSLLLAWRRINPADSLSRTAAATLGALHRLGPLRLTALADHEAVSQPAMTGLVTRLESQGFVTRTRDPSDRRAVIIDLTPLGSAVIDQRRRHYADTIAAMVGRLPAADFERLVDALPALRQLAESAHDQTTSPEKDPR